MTDCKILPNLLKQTDHLHGALTIISDFLLNQKYAFGVMKQFDHNFFLLNEHSQTFTNHEGCIGQQVVDYTPVSQRYVILVVNTHQRQVGRESHKMTMQGGRKGV